MGSTKLAEGLLLFRRAGQSVIGCGFRIYYAGRWQYSVAWPDAVAERYTDQEMDRRKIACWEAGEAEGHPVTHADLSPGADGFDAESMDGPLDLNFQRISPEEAATLTDDGPAGDMVVPENIGDWTGEANVAADMENADRIVKGEEPAAVEIAETEAEEEAEDADAEPTSEAESIRQYLAEHPNAKNKVVIAALKEQGIQVTSSQVSRAKA